MEHISSFTDIINLWPSSEDFGQEIGVTGISARAMKRRNKISSKYWDTIVQQAHSRGFPFVTHEALAKLAAPRINKSKKSRSN